MNKRLTAIIALALVVPLPMPAEAAEESRVPQRLARQMRALNVPQSSVGLLVTKLETGEVVWTLNADQPRNPASTMKLVTTFAALDVLGPGFRWPTEAYSAAPRGPGGSIEELYLKGYGNPFWVAEEFSQFILDMEQLGTRSISGDIVLDGTHFSLPEADPEDFDGKGYRVYNVLPHPLTMNFNSVRFLLVPDAHSGQLTVRTQPEFSNLVIDNRISLERSACRNGNIDLDMRVQELLDGNTRVSLSGRFPSRCPQFELTRSVLSAEEQLVGAFVSTWRRRGGEVKGSWRTGEVPEGARLLHRQMSRPLGDLIRSTNKFSNNVMARQIFLTLGAEAYGAPSDIDKSTLAVERSLAAHGLTFAELEIDNGAGLSRTARIAPNSLYSLLAVAWKHRYGSDFFGSLPVPGVDGTLENRFPSGDYVGQAYVKTGTLDHVTAIAGLVQALSGERYLLVFMINHDNIHRGAGRALQKTLLRILVNDG